MQRPAQSWRRSGRQAAEKSCSPASSPLAGVGQVISAGRMGSCSSAPNSTADASNASGAGALVSGSSGTGVEGRLITIERKTRPPQRLEGGGFTIVDIMSGFATEQLDPFLIWHELPRAFYKPGEMPGAPLHPHRGFSECPYAKEMTGKDGPGDLDCFFGRDHEGNRHRMRTGDFEFGQVGEGFEHEGLVDPKWTGHLHFFQLWINLPRAHKMDPPRIINCASSKLPVVEISTNPRATVKVLLGEDVFGCTSPVKSQHVPVQYLDFELTVGSSVAHVPPPEMQTRLAYVYRGTPKIGSTASSRGEFLLLGLGDRLDIAAVREDAGILFIAGRKIGEPVVQHGPFVMTTRQEIQKCFQDYQRGLLCGKMAREVIV